MTSVWSAEPWLNGPNPPFHAFRVDVDQQLHAVLFGHAVRNSYNLRELPGRVDVEQRKRRRARVECLPREVQHDRRVLPSRVEHHRAAKLGHDLAHDVESTPLRAGRRWGRGGEAVSGEAPPAGLCRAVSAPAPARAPASGPASGPVCGPGPVAGRGGAGRMAGRTWRAAFLGVGSVGPDQAAARPRTPATPGLRGRAPRDLGESLREERPRDPHSVGGARPVVVDRREVVGEGVGGGRPGRGLVEAKTGGGALGVPGALRASRPCPP